MKVREECEPPKKISVSFKVSSSRPKKDEDDNDISC